MIRIILTLVAALAFATPAAAQTVAGCGATAIAKADAANPAKLTAAADCFAKVKALAAAAELARRDRVAVLTAPPPFQPTPAVAPTIDGVPAINSGLDVKSLTTPAWGTGAIPGPELPGVQGAFRFLCAPSHNAYDDPILYPGQPGKSHLHTFFGNTKADASSTYASLRTAGDSTCNDPLNRSAYWTDALLTPAGKVLTPDYITIYYKRPPQGSIYCSPPYARECRALPRGLRYVYGYNMQEPAKSSPADQRWWNCDGPGAVPGHYATVAATIAAGCPAGARLGKALVGPDCWDGKNLDSADHRSHMAYAFYDGLHAAAVCDAQHPVKLPFFEMIAWYWNDGSIGLARSSSDLMMNLPGGTTAHADWFGAWEDSVKDAWTGNCIDKALSCSGGDLGNGTQIKTVRGYDMPSGRPAIDPPVQPVG